MSTRLSVSVFALACGLASLAAPAFAMQEQGSNASIAPASVIVFNQKLDGSNVKLTYAYAPQNGFAVVYGSDQHGKPDNKVLGSIALTAGDHRDVKIPISGDVKQGSPLWVSLYQAKGDGATFDRANATSYWGKGPLPSTNEFVVQ